jgi:uncharacterized protein (DUF433 family)
VTGRSTPAIIPEWPTLDRSGRGFLMSTAFQYPHLTLDPDGTPRVAGTRYKVLHLAAEHYHHGWTAEELLRQHTDLRPEQVYAALTYFYDHHAALVDEMNRLDALARHEAARQPLTRAELLRRRANAGP